MWKKLLVSPFVLFFANLVFSNDYYADFLKGNMQDKTEAVKKSADKNGGIALQSLEFCCQSYQFLKNDKSLETLAAESVKIMPNTENFSNVLANVFNTFDSEMVKTAVVDNVSKYAPKMLSENASKPVISAMP